MNAKVAIIVPVYNQEKYLRKCLDSLINQTFSDIEIICFNDASTDSSLSILQEYAAKDKRLQIINSKINIKQGGGRNAGIRKSTAPYIMFVDPDDWVAPNYVERYYSTAVETGAELVTGNYNIIIDGNCTQVCLWGKCLFQDTSTLKKLRLEIDVPIWVNIYKRELFFSNNLFFPENIQLGEDTVISSALFLAANKIIKIDDHLYNYTIISTSSSHIKDTSLFVNRFPTAIAAMNNLKRIDKDNCYEEEIITLFIRSYFALPIEWAMGSYDKVLYDQIQYAATTVTDYVSTEELNRFISTQPRGSQLVYRLALHSPRFAVITHRVIKQINNLRLLLRHK